MNTDFSITIWKEQTPAAPFPSLPYLEGHKHVPVRRILELELGISDTKCWDYGRLGGSFG